MLAAAESQSKEKELLFIAEDFSMMERIHVDMQLSSMLVGMQTSASQRVTKTDALKTAIKFRKYFVEGQLQNEKESLRKVMAKTGQKNNRQYVRIDYHRNAG